jgi:RNA polymerase sigma-70 factor (ECF subfamily)
VSEPEPYADLIHRVRRGDADAAEELWRRYEPLLRREVRLRLRDPRLRRLFDETDVCQSVMASFFVRAAAGQFDIDGPEKLQRLLLQMGRNKVTTHARRHSTQRRDFRREEGLPEEGDVAAGAAPSPSQNVVWRDLLQRFRERLGEEERQLADLRAQGREWAEIAAELGGTPDGRRVQLKRAVTRVSRELGLDDAEEE